MLANKNNTYTGKKTTRNNTAGEHRNVATMCLLFGRSQRLLEAFPLKTIMKQSNKSDDREQNLLVKSLVLSVAHSETST